MLFNKVFCVKGGVFRRGLVERVVSSTGNFLESSEIWDKVGFDFVIEWEEDIREVRMFF